MVNKEVIREAVSHLRLKFLMEKMTDSKWVKYDLYCGVCNYKHKNKRFMMRHMTVHFKNMFHCTKCVKGLSQPRSHIKNIHSRKANDDTDFVAGFGEGSAGENESTLLVSNFVQLLENCDYGPIADEEYQNKRSSYPNYITINKELLKEAVSNIKLKLLSEKSTDSKWVKYDLCCGLCDYKHKTRRNLMLHMTVHFKNMFHCIKCAKGIGHVGLHIKIKHSGKVEGLQICDICNKQVKTKSQLARHKASHEMVYCDQCEFVCEGREKLTRHRHQKHTDPVSCPVCQKVFTKKHHLKNHLALHGDEVFNCDQCGMTYKSLASLRGHIKVAHNSEEVSCEFCGKIFATYHRYNRHKLVSHTNVRSYECPKCEYKGSTKYYLQCHMEKHEEAKLACNHCGKTFRQRGALKFHIMTHTGEKPYACSDCTYRCIQPFELRKHFLKQHNKVIERPGLYLSTSKHESTLE